MFCEIVNKTMFTVRVKSENDEHILQPEESTHISCDEDELTVALSMLMESFAEKSNIGNIFTRFIQSFRSEDMRFNKIEHMAHFLSSTVNGNLTWEYRISLDSGYTYYDVAEGERFLITFMEQEYELGEYCRTPRLMKENGGAPALIRFFEKPKDEAIAKFRKKRIFACRRNLAILLCIFVSLCVLLFAVTLMNTFSRGYSALDIFLNCIDKITYPAAGGVLSITNYRYCTKYDFITDFCSDESY